MLLGFLGHVLGSGKGTKMLQGCALRAYKSHVETFFTKIICFTFKKNEGIKMHDKAKGKEILKI